MDFWMAFDAVEPIGDQWRQFAELRSSVMQLLSVMYAANGVKFQAPVAWQEYMPERFMWDRPETPVTPEPEKDKESQMAEMKRVGAMLGFKR